MRDEIRPTLSVEQALDRVLAKFHVLAAESVPILDGLGRVLAEDVFADMDIPPLANSAMDGYAVRGDDLERAPTGSPLRLRVVADLPAGQTLARSVGDGEAVRIMTGAPVPDGADTVVRFEDTRRGDDGDSGWVDILERPSRGRNVRAAGEDVRQGAQVLTAGAVLRAQEIGMLASVGRADVSVIRRPRVAILATGDEIVDIQDALAPGKIRNINSYSIAAQVRAFGAQPLLLGIARDRTDELVGTIQSGLESGADMFVTSGGVSVGDFDLVKDILRDQGEIDFWWVNIKPGKPMAFGTIGDVPLLALPGNPVAAMISFGLFGRPAILKMLGHSSREWPSTTASLGEAIERKDGRRHYFRVKLRATSGGLVADLTGDQGSGILSSMVEADGIAVIPEDRRHLPAGETVQVLLLN